MSVTRRGKVYYLAFRPFGKLIYVKTAATNKTEAKLMEAQILTACKSGDYRNLPPESKAVCIRLYENQGWELPESLAGERPKQELTLWRGVEMFLSYPTIKDCPAKKRYGYCLGNLVEKLGAQTPVKSIWVPDLRRYQAERVSAGAKPATVNWEFGTLSKLFGVLIELQLVDANPVRLLKRLSTKSNEREVYLSQSDVERIADRCPRWFQDLIWVAFYAGMRRGEITNLRRHQVNIKKRVITLSPTDTKEGAWKRIPLREELIPIIECAMKVQALGTDVVFLVRDDKGIRPAGKDTVKNPWGRAMDALEWPEPRPVYRDLRATWRTNARRSGMREDLEKEIMGHQTRGKSIHERYGRISDQELLQAIDSMSFCHGETEVLANGPKKCKQGVSKNGVTKKKATGQGGLSL